MIIVPYQQISADALRALLEEFITREGTDYGMVELTLAEKVNRAYQQLEREEVVIIFDDETERCHIINARELASLP